MQRRRRGRKDVELFIGRGHRTSQPNTVVTVDTLNTVETLTTTLSLVVDLLVFLVFILAAAG